MDKHAKFHQVEVSAAGVRFGNAWYSHESITGYSADQLNEGNCHITGQQYLKWLNSAPVPPAGDVEVLAPIGKIFDEKYNSVVFYRGTGDQTKRYHLPGTEFVAHDTAMELVTRLTAERDGLLAKLETADKAYTVVVDTSLQLFEDLQRLKSEQTKARQLLARVSNNRNYPIGWATQDDVSAFLATPITHNVDESCGQDAEAAKGGAA